MVNSLLLATLKKDLTVSSQLFDVWNWQGKVGRTRYLISGLLLLAIKHNLDRLVAALYGYPLENSQLLGF